MRLKSSFLFFLVFINACSFVGSPVSNSLASSGTHPFSVHDMLAMDRLSDPQVSPDGKLIVFTLRKTDLEEDKGRTDIWLIATDGTGLRRLTSHPEADYNPRWAPDGHFFLSFTRWSCVKQN